MTEYNGKGVWCVAELRRGQLSSTIYELLTAGRKLADSMGEPLTAVVLGGPGIQDRAAEVAKGGADRVLVLEDPALKDFIDDGCAAALAGLAGKEQPRHILLPATVYGRSLAPRLAVMLKGSLAADAVELSLDADKHMLATRSCYAGNVVSTVLLKRFPGVATVRPLAFPRAERTGTAAEITAVAAAGSAAKGRFLSFTAEQSGEIDLGSAERIVSGGRGLGNSEGFALLRQLAGLLGAAVGASRATVDAGWIPYRHQVGLTGRAVRPRLYIACGISGQIQHLAGMKSADVIVAINTDPECPMMKLANYAVVGDVYQVVPAMIEEIRKARGENHH